MRLIYSEIAALDMEQMWWGVFQASKDLETADRYRDDMKAQVRERARNPLAGQLVINDGEETDYRFVVFKRYIAFYEVEEDTMKVVRVLYRGTDRMKRMFP